MNQKNRGIETSRIISPRHVRSAFELIAEWSLNDDDINNIYERITNEIGEDALNDVLGDFIASINQQITLQLNSEVTEESQQLDLSRMNKMITSVLYVVIVGFYSLSIGAAGVSLPGYAQNIEDLEY